MATLRLNQYERDRLFDRVNEQICRAEAALPRLQADWQAKGLCVLASVFTIGYLAEMNIRAVLQAGSAAWVRLRREDDDGKIADCFGYQWDPSSETSQALLAHGVIPELHAWVGIPAQDGGPGELIDMMVGRLPSLCRAHGGVWTAKEPPPYLWCLHDRIPTWCRRYQADRMAIHVVQQIVEKQLKPVAERASSSLVDDAS